jgi:predicted amidohydrolase YtcJ
MTSLFLLSTFLLTAEPLVSADLILKDAKIWTGQAKQADAEAMAIWKGRILKVGTNAEVEAFAGPKTRVIALQGKRVVPGFYDSHVHLLGGGQQLARVELKDAKDEAEFGKRLKEFDEKTPRDRWILGGNWDHDRAFNGKLPTAAIIDQYVPNRPVFIQRYDGHMALANTAALKLANITASTADPAGGVIERLADGKTPSGLLKDNAMSLVDKLIPEPNEEEIREAVKAALKALAEVGITSVQDMDGSSPETRRNLFRVLQQLAKKGELTCKVDLRWPIAQHKELANLGVQSNYGGQVRIGGLKGFMDGSLGSSTAKMFEPYLNQPNTTGVYVTQPEVMKSLMRSADAAGLSLAIHAIGDQANSVLLDLFEETIKTNGPRDRRFRIEHAQHLRPEDYTRFQKLGVIASMQPFHVADDGRWAEGRIGVKRCQSSYAFKSLLEAKATLAFGSDWPVAPLNPFVGLDAAVNRLTLDPLNTKPWFPEQSINVREAMRAYTFGSAYAASQEGDRGRLLAGMSADLAVLNQDIFDAKLVKQLGKTETMMTVMNGKVVFERK